MASSFDPNLSTAKDRLRAALGDRDVVNPLRSDEEYWAQLDLTPDERLATAAMAEGLAAEYARKPTTISDEDGTISWAGRVSTWLALAASLRKQVSTETSKAGGFGSIRAHRGDECAHSEYSRERGWNRGVW